HRHSHQGADLSSPARAGGVRFRGPALHIGDARDPAGMRPRHRDVRGHSRRGALGPRRHGGGAAQGGAWVGPRLGGRSVMSAAAETRPTPSGAGLGRLLRRNGWTLGTYGLFIAVMIYTVIIHPSYGPFE